jgi:signal transduction histidine kinase
MQNNFSLTKKWHSAILSHAENSSYPYVVFGVFGVISYPVYYLIWAYLAPIGYENLPLRLIAVFLCAPLIFLNHWPDIAKKFLPYYWYLTILYSLPFLFTYLLLRNHLSSGWVLNSMTVIVLSILLLDLIPLVIILLIGIGLGYLYFKWNVPGEHVRISSDIVITYLSVLIFGVLFAQNKANIEKEKLRTMKSLGATVAHELRTPLMAIQFGISGAREYFPVLVKGYISAQENKLDVEPIKAKHLQTLSSVFDIVESEIKYANTIINMILMNIKQNTISAADFQILSMNACVEETFHRYPFRKGEKELIECSNENDFLFRGNKALMVHVLFNLMKNSFYYIEEAGKGKIKIWYGFDDKNNTLYFKDTAKGIPPSIIPKLFEKFYTTTLHGTGLGLAFCKMVIVSFGGTIKCRSKLGEFTQFEINFPKIAAN